MVKLKCWKKIDKRKIKQDRWESDNDQVFVGKLPKGYRAGSIYTDWERKAKTEKEALKLAKDYMKKNDKC